MLIDEYQDTNFAQYRLIHLLVKKHQNLCVIGDDYQSIYSFRGADFTNILNFEKDFPSAQVILLEQNYRSTANILNNANKIIANNETGRKKNLWTDNNPGKNLQLYEYWNERDEARQIVQIIQDEMAGGNSLNQKQTQREFSDFAILYRMNESLGLIVGNKICIKFC